MNDNNVGIVNKTTYNTQKIIRYILMFPVAIISVCISTFLCDLIFRILFDVHKNGMFLSLALFWTVSGFISGVVFSQVLTMLAPNYKKHILAISAVLWVFIWLFSIAISNEDYWKVYSTVLFYIGVYATYKTLIFEK